MLNEILEIPGNRPVFADLQRLLAEKKAIAFVGAGASAGLYPLWGELIRQLCDEAVESGFASDADRQFWLSMADTKAGQVVRGIRQKLTTPQLGNLLRNIFGPKPDGPGFTATHAALMRVPFSGYVTTNYDPGLIEARRVERPAVTAVGWSTWRDGDELESWRDPARLADPSWCPILLAHGFYQRSDTIVLGIEEYRRAYDPGPWRRLFEHLWSSTHLVFVGFGFSDPFLDFITGEIVTQTAEQTAAEGRHIAFIGLGADEPYSEERRRFFLQNYNVRPLFYPVVGHDHSALLTLLDALASKAPSPPPPVAHSPRPSPADFPSRWVHETTNDERFTGREDELARLNRWVADPAVRVIGITAVGGTGKTALVGHWLKNTTGWRSRPFAGLFAWSFYQERNSAVFLRTLLEWANETFGTAEPDNRTELVPAALKLLRTHALVVVLDGLEVQQEGPEEARHGAFLDGALREFLGGLSIRQHESLGVLTSRFVFADLDRYLGTAFHQLELPGLQPEQGAALLAELDVHGTETDRIEVSQRLEGHPLGLRVFAEAIPETQRDYPSAFLTEAFRAVQLSPDSPLGGKIRRLLAFYQEKLPLNQVRLLNVIALFRSPEAESTILRLARGLFEGKRKPPLSKDSVFTGELRKLHSRGILTREPIEGGYGYACHPILRDHFRAALLSSGSTTVRRAVDLLGAKPSRSKPRSVKEIEPVLLAIELLLDADDLDAAGKLYRTRLEDGRTFLDLPAVLEGLHCALGFVRAESRMDRPSAQRRLGAYLRDVGIFASLAGHYELASRSHIQGNEIARKLNQTRALVVGLQNEAVLSVFPGSLEKAAALAKEALDLAHQFLIDLPSSYANCGWVSGLSGEVQKAAEDFAIANILEKETHSDSEELFSSRGVEWAEFLIRVGHPGRAVKLTSMNLRACENSGWRDNVARCHWILGACALAEAHLDEAAARLREAEPIFHNGQMLFELANLHISAGTIALAHRDGDAVSALQRAAEALALAQPRGMRLVHADALVLRGRARLIEAETLGRVGTALTDSLLRALDDSDDALRLARECGYPWAERDALALQADAHAALAHAHKTAGNTSAASRIQEAAHRARTEADALSARLRLTEEDLAEADAKAAAWLEEWKRKNKK